jgi:Na+/phosphate symporter
VKSGWHKVKTGGLLAGAMLLFLLAINLMIASLHQLGEGLSGTILLATSNPFSGLFIGILVTAVLQSSSTTTSLVIAFVASRAISVEAAIPIIMGANIGTTITSTIVSLGFINRKKEFRRAVAAGTYHDIFNILTAAILFPLEYYYGWLAKLASKVADLFLVPVLNPAEGIPESSAAWVDPVVDFLTRVIPGGPLLALFSVALLFGSILWFRRIVSNLLDIDQPERFSRFFFKRTWKSFSWGVVTTAAIRSSTITTSLVVPMVAKKFVTLRQAAPFIVGANIGTTVTGFLAVILNPTTREAIIIAAAHLVFNLAGVILFLVVPFVRNVPLILANRLGKLTLRYRLAGLIYLLSTFFVIPFLLIYLHQHKTTSYNLLYEYKGREYRSAFQLNQQTGQGRWLHYSDDSEEPSQVVPIVYRNRMLSMGQEKFLFQRPGYCWDVEGDNEKIQTCVEKILPRFEVAGASFDSVFVFHQQSVGPDKYAEHWYYFSAPLKMLLIHETDIGSGKEIVEKLKSITEN